LLFPSSLPCTLPLAPFTTIGLFPHYVILYGSEMRRGKIEGQTRRVICEKNIVEDDGDGGA
jgi:hypothetical protein